MSLQILPNRHIIVSTDDKTVRFQLRLLNQPMCVFGEGPGQRRERLRLFLTENPEAIEVLKLDEEAKRQESQGDNEEFFYYEGTELLKKIRYNIARHSIIECSKRLEYERSLTDTRVAQQRFLAQHSAVEEISNLQDCGLYDDSASTLGGLKTINSISFNAPSSMLATAHSSGSCKLWDFPSTTVKSNLNGHNGIMAKCINFHPKSGLNVQPTGCVNLASCAMDGSVILWSLDSEEPLAQLNGPQAWRVTRVKFYNDGSLLATCCSDNSWRLFDLETQTEILYQEGHASGVHDICFHPDGSLACTSSLDKTSYFWDLRSGRSIWLAEGHTGGVTSCDFSPNGYHIATGSMDNTVRVWNLRQRKLEYTIPAHTNLVSHVKFQTSNGYYLATSSFDSTVKFWSAQTWAALTTLEGHDGRIPGFAITHDSKYVAVCYSQYIKLWTCDNDEVVV